MQFFDKGLYSEGLPNMLQSTWIQSCFVSKKFNRSIQHSSLFLNKTFLFLFRANVCFLLLLCLCVMDERWRDSSAFRNLFVVVFYTFRKSWLLGAYYN